MKTQKPRAYSDKQYTAKIRTAERKVRGGICRTPGGYVNALTVEQFCALQELSRAAVSFCRGSLRGETGMLPSTFVYRGWRYGLTWSSFARVHVAITPGGDSFISTPFFSLVEDFDNAP
jgi:hypothetical protein